MVCVWIVKLSVGKLECLAVLEWTKLCDNRLGNVRSMCICSDSLSRVIFAVSFHCVVSNVSEALREGWVQGFGGTGRCFRVFGTLVIVLYFFPEFLNCWSYCDLDSQAGVVLWRPCLGAV